MDKCRHAGKFGILKGLQMSGEPVRMNYALLKESQSPRMFQAGLESSYYLPPLLPAFPCHPGTGLNCRPDAIAGTCTVIQATLASKYADHGLCTRSDPIHHLPPIPGHRKAFPVISIQLEDTKKCPCLGPLVSKLILTILIFLP